MTTASVLGKVLVAKEKACICRDRWVVEDVPTGTILLIISEVNGQCKFIHNNAPGFLERHHMPLWSAIEPEDKLGGKTFVFTGALSNSREYFKIITDLFGGKIGSAVTSSTDYLVSGDPTYMGDSSHQSTKAKKAKSLGVPVINEAEFHKMIR